MAEEPRPDQGHEDHLGNNPSHRLKVKSLFTVTNSSNEDQTMSPPSNEHTDKSKSRERKSKRDDQRRDAPRPDKKKKSVD